jgi:hypothetical protein
MTPNRAHGRGRGLPVRIVKRLGAADERGYSNPVRHRGRRSPSRGAALAPGLRRATQTGSAEASSGEARADARSHGLGSPLDPPGMRSWPGPRTGSVACVAWTSSTARNSIAIINCRELEAARMRVATGNWSTCTATSRKRSVSLQETNGAAYLLVRDWIQRPALLERAAAEAVTYVAA